MTISELTDVCARNGLPIGPEERALLEHYASLLANWNSKINLISRKDEAHILDRHILHSLTLRMPAICDYDFGGKRALDLGTGGGLPGIPLKIVTPSLDITLVDSIQKKITACQAMISALPIPLPQAAEIGGDFGIHAICGRAEELAKQPANSHQYDVIVSRAVAPLEDLVKWSKGLLQPRGVLFSLKGGELREELERAKRVKVVGTIELKALDLIGYSEFLKEEKKLVRVSFLL